MTSERPYSEKQLMAARAIRLIELKLEPKCEGCGYGADRPNCVNGGGCGRHEQEDVIAYRAVIDELRRVGELRGDNHGLIRKMALADLWGPLTGKQLDLLADLAEAKNGRLSSRQHDERYRWLADRGACYYWAQGRWHVEITDHGRAWLAASETGGDDGG